MCGGTAIQMILTIIVGRPYFDYEYLWNRLEGSKFMSSTSSARYRSDLASLRIYTWSPVGHGCPILSRPCLVDLALYLISSMFIRCRQMVICLLIRPRVKFGVEAWGVLLGVYYLYSILSALH